MTTTSDTVRGCQPVHEPTVPACKSAPQPGKNPVARLVHEFANGIKVFDDHLTDIQRARYRKWNVHEAEEEAVFVRIIKALPERSRFLNVGSAIGYYPLLAKKIRPDLIIHAVEPLDRHRRFFLENVELNGLSAEDFIIYRQGICSLKGLQTFFDRGYGSRIELGQTKEVSEGSRIRRILQTFRVGLSAIASGSKEARPIQIPTITLDDLIDIVGHPIGLLQMDVQGLEVDVLKGFSNGLRHGTVETILIGTHSPDLHRECIDILRDNGYVIDHEVYETQTQPDGIVVAVVSPENRQGG